MARDLPERSNRPNPGGQRRSAKESSAKHGRMEKKLTSDALESITLQCLLYARSHGCPRLLSPASVPLGTLPSLHTAIFLSVQFNLTLISLPQSSPLIPALMRHRLPQYPLEVHYREMHVYIPPRA